MTEITQGNTPDFWQAAASIVGGYVSNNLVNREDLPALIQEVFMTLTSLKNQSSHRLGALVPAVPIQESVTPDHIVCLEDGKKLKMIKRHLKALYNMSVEEYKMRWNLPSDYPVVAPNYAKRRSDLAKVIGLGSGRKRKKAS